MVERITELEIDAYMDGIRSSGVMGKSTRRLRLLDHLIRSEVMGDGSTLKAYSIGLDVFDKSADFDPSSDSSVRVEIGRVRNAIALFEASEFANTKLVVDIPVGTYRPSIAQRDRPQIEPESRSTRRSIQRFGSLVLIIVMTVVAFGLFLLASGDLGEQVEQSADNRGRILLQLQPLIGDATFSSTAMSALRRSLAGSRSIEVLSPVTESEMHPEAEFLVKGSIASFDDDKVGIDVELINLGTQRLIWTETAKLDSASLIEDYASRGLGNELRVRLYGASKEILEGRDPQNLTPEQLFVMATWVPGPAINAVEWELERVALMDLALKKSPDFGAAHSVMADKLAYLANVYGPSNTKELQDQAKWHAQRAMELSPLDADVVFNVAQSRWHSGKIAASHKAMKRVVELDENHDLARFLTMVVPYSCSVAPNEVVANAKAFDRSLSADNPIRWLTLTWVAWLHMHRAEYELALDAEERAALIFEIPYTFMRHAMLLNKLGRTKEAAEVIMRQRDNWPDIDPQHFAEVTIPRLCTEEPQETRFIEGYAELARAVAPYLE